MEESQSSGPQCKSTGKEKEGVNAGERERKLSSRTAPPGSGKNDLSAAQVALVNITVLRPYAG